MYSLRDAFDGRGAKRKRDESRSLYGRTGDNCYVSEVCRSRRSYTRHRYQRNQTRKQKWHETKAGVEVTHAETQATAQLIVYREPRYNAPIDGIAAVVRRGKTKLVALAAETIKLNLVRC